MEPSAHAAGLEVRVEGCDPGDLPGLGGGCGGRCRQAAQAESQGLCLHGAGRGHLPCSQGAHPSGRCLASSPGVLGHHPGGGCRPLAPLSLRGHTPNPGARCFPRGVVPGGVAAQATWELESTGGGNEKVN